MRDRPDDGGGDELQDATARRTSPMEAALARGVDGPRWALFLALAATVVVVDQLTKAWILANVDPARPIHVVGDLVRLVMSRNTGALFGLFRDNASLFAVVSVVVIAAIAWYHGRSPGSTTLSTALGLLLGGAIGNLVDRLRLGYVVDFVDAGIGDLRFYTFNVADAAISTALLVLLLVSVWPSLLGDGRPAEARRGGVRAGRPDGRTDA